jgi:predicted dehydrogenase
MPLTRRQFHRSTLAAAASGAVLFPAIVPARAFGAAERIRLGCIGIRNQGTGNLKNFLKKKDADVVALCDVDSDVLAKAHTVAEAGSKPKAASYADYRKLLDDKTVDAVVITTPDHWHARMTVDACTAGKDVYCEKPLTLTVAEGPAMIAAARKYNRVVQTGSQQRSDDKFRRACEMIRSGQLGKIKLVEVGLPAVNFDGPAVADSTPPANLDYDFWLGPAPNRPYNEKHVHYLFRFFWDYSGGQMTNFGAHHLDITQWALGRDESGPSKIEATAKFHPEHWYEVPMTSRIEYTYDDGVKVVVEQGTKMAGGCTFHGEKGKLYVTRGKIDSTPAGLLADAPAELPVKLEVSKDHHQNWLDCIRSRNKPICDVAIGHRSATVCHLGNLAIRLGRPITWDPKAETIVGDPEAAAMLSRPYRSPWVNPTV